MLNMARTYWRDQTIATAVPMRKVPALLMALLMIATLPVTVTAGAGATSSSTASTSPDPTTIPTSQPSSTLSHDELDGEYTFSLIGSDAEPAVAEISSRKTGEEESGLYAFPDDDVRVGFEIESDEELDSDAVDHIEWSVSGPAEVENDSMTTELSFYDTGEVTVTATIVANNGTRYETFPDQVEINVIDRVDSIEHLSFTTHYSITERRAELFKAYLADHSPETYRQIQQRTTGLPDEIDVILKSEPCGGAGGCAKQTEPEIRVDPTTPSSLSVFRHELIHIAQNQIGGTTERKAWRSFKEGHAELEETPDLTAGARQIIPQPIPKKSSFLSWDELDYDRAKYFVLAMYERYGAAKVNELMGRTGYRPFTYEFEDVMGESFDDFYESLDPPTQPHPYLNDSYYLGLPTDNLTHISDTPLMPMFEYHNETLRALGPDSAFEPLSVSWDVDGDGTFEHEGRTISWTPPSSGSHTVTVKYANNSSSVTRTQTFSVSDTYGDCGFTGAVAEIDTNEDCVIDDDELGDAIQAWARGEYTDSEINDMISAWAAT